MSRGREGDPALGADFLPLTLSPATMFPPLPKRVARPQEGWEPGWARRNMEPAGRDRGSLQDVAAFLLEQTKFHGLRYVFSGRLSCPRRAFWAMAVLASLALLLTWSSNRIRYLLSSPVHTKVHMAYARNLTFPAVTICNNNLLLLRRMGRADLHLAGYWLGLLTQRLRPEPAARELLREERWRWLEKLLDFSHYLPPPQQGHNTLHLLDRLGHQLEEMLLSCRFRGERCGPHNFTTVSQGW